MTRPAERLASWLIRHRARVLALSLLLFVVAGVRTGLTYMQLRSDLEELLPKTAPAVSALDTLRQRLPGLRHLGVVVDTGGKQNVRAAERFVDDLQARIEQYPEPLVANVRTSITSERKFVETYFLQLMAPEDVRRLRKAVEKRRDWEVSRALDLNLLDDEEDPAPEIPIQELKKKYQKRHNVSLQFPNDRLVSDNGKTVVLLVQTGYHATGQDLDRQLLSRVKSDIRELGFPDKYAPAMRVGFAADVATRVEELEGLATDLTLSGGLVLALVVLVIVWYFRSWKAPVILGLPLLTGTVAAFGLVALPPLDIRYLNSNTAFLGAIVVGNGINSGIIVLARFREERGRGVELEDAIGTALAATWRPTLAAALAASAAYGSLIFTNFRGFNQFGWIGGIGMVLCWALTMLMAPALIHWLGGSMGVRTAVKRPSLSPLARRTQSVVFRPRAVLLVTLTLSALSAVGLTLRSSDWIEYDLSKLRRRDSWESGERYWGGKMDATLKRYLTPSVVMANDVKQARQIEDRLKQLKSKRKAGDLIATIRSARSLLPDSRFESIEEAKKLKKALTPKLMSELDPNDRRLVEGALSERALKPLSEKDLPPTLVAGMRENDGRIGRSVLVYPKLGGGTWDAQRIESFADDVRGAAKAEAGNINVAGTVLLSSDIARALQSDGPRATLLSLLAVLAICLVAFRPREKSEAGVGIHGRAWALALAAVGSLFVGVLLMLGALAWSGAKLNFSNFVALPITFGIAADYSINILKRYQAEGKLELKRVFVGTGGAVALCSATTIIGFGSLLVAQNRALFSFGVFAVTGEFACLLTAVVVLPAVLLLIERYKNRVTQ